MYPRQRHRAECGIDSGEQAAQTDQHDRAEQWSGPIQLSKYLEIVEDPLVCSTCGFTVKPYGKADMLRVSELRRRHIHRRCLVGAKNGQPFLAMRWRWGWRLRQIDLGSV